MAESQTSVTLEELDRAATLVYHVMAPTPPVRMAQAAQSSRLHCMGET